MNKAQNPLNYVYVRLRGSKKQPKKVILPQTLKAFKQNCKSFEKGDNIIYKILSERGTVINDISKVRPGATLELVLIDKYRKIKDQNNDPQMEVLHDPENIQSFFISATSVDEKGRVVEDKEKQKEKTDDEEGGITILEEEDKNDDSEPQRLIPKKLRVAHRVVKTTRSGSPKTGSPSIALKSLTRSREIIDAKNQKVEETKEEPEELQDPTQFDSVLDVFLETLSEKETEDMLKVYKLELYQRNIWIRSAFELMLEEDFTDHQLVSFYPLMRNAVRAQARKNSHAIGSVFSHQFNLYIYGPNKSGKSTFLEAATREAIMHLAISDEWKGFLVLPINFKKFLAQAPTNMEFLQTMVQYTINAIAREFPLFANAKEEVLVYFQDLFTNPSKLILKKFPLTQFSKDIIIQHITEVGKLLLAIWNDYQSSPLWYQLIFDIPQQIAQAFGLRKVLFICDNLDSCDITIKPEKPLVNPNQGVNLIPIVKRALAQNQYIITCGSSEGFNNISMEIEEGDISLYPISTFVTTYGVVDPEQIGPKMLSVDIGKERNVIIDSKSLGGCPAYAIRFYEALNLVKISMETYEDGEKDDALCNAKDGVQQLLQLLYPEIRVSIKSISMI